MMPTRTPGNYWRNSLRLVAVLLAVWFVVSFMAGILFVDELNTIMMGGFPLGFWFSQQGSILVFVVLILIYCVVMDRLDRTETQRLSEQVQQQNEAGL
jgi:putative solute:sodium symporter small subunit